MQAYRWNFLNDELGNSLAFLKMNSLLCIKVDENDFKLATIMSINKTRSVNDRQSALEGKSASRLDKTCIAIRQSNGKTCGNKTTLVRSDINAFIATQIETGITGISIFRKTDSGI